MKFLALTFITVLLPNFVYSQTKDSIVGDIETVVTQNPTPSATPGVTPAPPPDPNAVNLHTTEDQKSSGSQNTKAAQPLAQQPVQPQNQPTQSQAQTAPPPDTSQSAVQQIQQSLAAGNAPAARREVQQALRKDPDNPQLRQIDQLLTQHVSSPAQLETLKSKVQNIFGAGAALPDDNEEKAVLAEPIALGAAGNAARNLLPSSLRAAFAQRDLIKEGATKLGLQDFSGAEHNLNQAIAGNPRNVGAYVQRAEIRRLRGRLPGAIEDTDTALALNPQDAWAHIVRARALNDLGNHQGALEAAAEAIAISPNNPAAFIARGRAEQALGDNASAQRDFKQAAAFAPEFEDLYRLTLGEGAAVASAAPIWTPTLSRRAAIYGSSALAALFLFGLAFLRGRGDGNGSAKTSRQPMRIMDRNSRSPTPLPGRPGIWH